jgi:ssDNA-binding Zn-finger/Zn-ribbon topoisomerase 1
MPKRLVSICPFCGIQNLIVSGKKIYGCTHYLHCNTAVIADGEKIMAMFQGIWGAELKEEVENG